MSDLRQIIRVTQTQMNTLLSGGEVGGYTIQDDVLYAVEHGDYVRIATAEATGGVKLGCVRQNNKLPLQLDLSGRAFVQADDIETFDAGTWT